MQTEGGMTDTRQHSCIEVKVSSLCRCRSFIHYISTAIKPHHVPLHSSEFSPAFDFYFQIPWISFKQNTVYGFRVFGFSFFLFFPLFFILFLHATLCFYLKWIRSMSSPFDRFAQHLEIMRKDGEILNVLVRIFNRCQTSLHLTYFSDIDYLLMESELSCTFPTFATFSHVLLISLNVSIRSKSKQHMRSFCLLHNYNYNRLIHHPPSKCLLSYPIQTNYCNDWIIPTLRKKGINRAHEMRFI